MKERIRTQGARYEKAMELIRADLGRQVSSLSLLDYNMLGLEVPPEALLETARFLRDTPDLAFQFLTCLAGVDREDRLEVVYILHSLNCQMSLQLKVGFPAEAAAVDSVVSIWPGANWYEREAYDMFGIDFRGHPNPSRILTDDEFVGHPLRKSYKTEGGLV